MRNNIIKSIKYGLLWAIPGEFVNQVVINNSPKSLIITLLVYVIFLPIGFFLQKYIDFFLKKVYISFVFQYLIFGFTGLFIEWNLLGNSPALNPDANQFGMFTFWALLFLAWKIYSNSLENDKRKIRLYYMLYFVFCIFPGIFFGDAGAYISINSFIWGTIVSNIFVFKYLKNNFLSSTFNQI